MKKILRTLFLLFVPAFVSINTFGQTTPKIIDVRSLEILRTPGSQITSFRMSGVEENNEPFEYYIHDSTAVLGFPSFMRCTPCHPPRLYSTNVFANPISIQIGQTSDVIKFYLTDSNSSVLYLGQRVFSRKGRFEETGVTELRGRIEVIVNGVGVAEVDNDVVLKGSWKIGFTKPILTPSGKFEITFTSFDYTLSDTRGSEAKQ